MIGVICVVPNMMCHIPLSKIYRFQIDPSNQSAPYTFDMFQDYITDIVELYDDPCGVSGASMTTIHKQSYRNMKNNRYTNPLQADDIPR